MTSGASKRVLPIAVILLAVAGLGGHVYAF
jgi:hypothetical protein